MEADIRNQAYTLAGNIADGMGFPLYYPNVSVPENPANEHLRVRMISTEPDSTNICSGESRYQWILQISVYVRDDVGEIIPMEYADSIKSQLPFGTLLSGADSQYRVNRTGNVISPVVVDGWLFIPIQFRLETIY